MEVETCEMCGQVLRRVWKMKIPGKEELHGVYCSKRCVEADIYGPALKGARPKFVGVFKSVKIGRSSQ